MRFVKDLRRRPINEFEKITQILADLLARVDEIVSPIGGWEYRTGRHVAPGRYEFDGPWKPYSPDILWGGEDTTAWFRAAAVVPQEMRGREVTARLVPGGEGILSVNGAAVCGLDYNHREYELTRESSGGERLSLELECYFRDAPDDSIRNDVRKTHKFETAQLVVKDRELLALYYDLSAALDLARAIAPGRPDISERLLKTINGAVAIVDPYAATPADYKAKALAARTFLAERLYDTGRDKPAGTLHLVGHSHLDLYYVWPYRESVRKNLRTNLIAAELMKRYGKYVFAQSQAKLFADMKLYRPKEFEMVRDFVRKGRFEAVGDMWVETDCNIACGEALVRQILYAKQFFEKEFGSQSSVCWLSDVFGVAGSLPQILAQGGFKVFYTTKHSIWHDTNDFPHNTFWWEGIDGTRIIAHIPPTHFIGTMEPDMLLAQWSQYRQKTEAPHVIYTYGLGDGGGGPTENMLEYAARYSRMEGLPEMRFSSAEEFARVLTDSAHDLPVWSDELYLEMHRGVNTTKGTLKRKNRIAESSLRSAEILSSIAALMISKEPPAEKLESMWKTLLEMHFHDAVTGTHCAEAGREIEAAYDTLIADATRAVGDTSRSIADGTAPDAVTVFNLTGAATAGHVIWNREADATLVSEGRAYDTQRLADGRLVTYVNDLPALGQKTLTIQKRDAGRRQSPFGISPNAIESPHFSLRFDSDGRIESLIDLDAGREVFAAPANDLRLFEDKPGRFEAWEIAKGYESRRIDAARFLGMEKGQSGPLLASVILNWRIGDSSLRQEVIAYAHSRRIDFHTEVDWRENQKILRVHFPLRIHAKRATYEIPFGTIERSTRPVNTFDEAKFEVPFLRWFDVGEHGYGVSFLNDGKYGGCVRENVASISLLKSPRFPDPTSDTGRHEFTYSLFPHRGDWREAGTFAEAVLLNSPFLAVGGASSKSIVNYVTLSRAGIAVEAFKKAEDGHGWILRLVDYYGQRGAVTVTMPLPVHAVEACNILERRVDESVTTVNGGFSYETRPFGIHSFRLEFPR